MCLNLISFPLLIIWVMYISTTSCFFYITKEQKTLNGFLHLSDYTDVMNTLKIDFTVSFLVIWNWIGKIWGGLKNYFYVRQQIKHDKNWPKMGIKKNLPGSYKKHRHAYEHAFLDANFCIWWCWLWASPTSSSSTQYAEFLLNSKKLSSTPGSKNDFHEQFITQNNFQLIYMMSPNGHSKVKSNFILEHYV